MSGNVQLAILHICLVKKWIKLIKWPKWPNFCNIWNLQINLGKTFSAKYINVYHLVLVLWKTYKGAPTTDKKIEENPPKWWKLPNFCNILEYQGIFWGNVFLKVHKSIHHQKENFISFPLFFISWEYFLYFWSYCTISDSIY